ncbi:hypothetical protein Vafri_9656 [Volvox africanus]|uniref:Uncharacterized protein n=1 Tax=Volvox africanus TaxID=51714 RepID=A0A8J4B500_9CHLO|nr:hypothetical protein Vafri_9656 [Volvox africanus]
MHQPVPFAAAGFMFAPARVLEDVPFDPSLDYLFHGEEALYRYACSDDSLTHTPPPPPPSSSSSLTSSYQHHHINIIISTSSYQHHHHVIQNSFWSRIMQCMQPYGDRCTLCTGWWWENSHAPCVTLTLFCPKQKLVVRLGQRTPACSFAGFPSQPRRPPSCSARLWTHGWDMFTPDCNVAFHHYNRDGAPKFWNVRFLCDSPAAFLASVWMDA